MAAHSFEKSSVSITVLRLAKYGAQFPTNAGLTDSTSAARLVLCRKLLQNEKESGRRPNMHLIDVA